MDDELGRGNDYAGFSDLVVFDDCPDIDVEALVNKPISRAIEDILAMASREKPHQFEFSELGLFEEIQIIRQRLLLPTDGAKKIIDRNRKKWLIETLANQIKSSYGQSLISEIQEILACIQSKRMIQGAPPFTENEILVLVCEIFYTSYLWHQERRKDGVSFTFNAHLLGAVRNLVRQGFLSLANILAALKHDDLEDLAIHRKDANKDLKAHEPRSEWLFCDDVYTALLKKRKPSSRGLEKGAINKFIEELPSIISKSEVTIRSLTSPELDETESADKSLADEKKAYHYLKNLIENGYAAIIKVIEQMQNAMTLEALGERGKPKARVMLLLHGLLARVLELEETEACIIENALKSLRPDILRAYKERQKAQVEALNEPLNALLVSQARRRVTDRLREVLGEAIVSEHLPAASVVEELNSMLTALSLPVEEASSNGLVERLLLDYEKGEVSQELDSIRAQIAGTLAPGVKGVRLVQVRPISVARYLDVRKLLENPDYQPGIPANESLFEVLVLVDDEAALKDAYQQVSRHFATTRGLAATPDSTKPGVKGLKVKINPKKVGNIHHECLTIRINTLKNESLRKRGVRADRGSPLPRDFKRKLQDVIREVDYTGRSVFEVAEERLLRPKLRVFTDTERPMEVPLMAGSTFLDFAASLPGDLGEKALIHGAKAYRRRPGVESREEVSFFDEVQEGDLCYIEVAGTDSMEVRLSDLAFTREDKTRERLDKWFSRRAIQNKKAGEKNDTVVREDRRKRGKEYIKELTKIFGINDERYLTLIAAEAFIPSEKSRKNSGTTSKGNALKAFEEIGSGRFNPLYSMSRFLNKKTNEKTMISIKLKMPNKTGVLEKLYKPIARKGINVENTQTNAIEDTSFSSVELTIGVEPHQMNYELLKLLLLLSYHGDMSLATPIFDFSSLEGKLNTIPSEGAALAV